MLDVKMSCPVLCCVSVLSVPVDSPDTFPHRKTMQNRQENQLSGLHLNRYPRFQSTRASCSTTPPGLSSTIFCQPHDAEESYPKHFIVRYGSLRQNLVSCTGQQAGCMSLYTKFPADTDRIQNRCADAIQRDRVGREHKTELCLTAGKS